MDEADPIVQNHPKMGPRGKTHLGKHRIGCGWDEYQLGVDGNGKGRERGKFA